MSDMKNEKKDWTASECAYLSGYLQGYAMRDEVTEDDRRLHRDASDAMRYLWDILCAVEEGKGELGFMV